MGDPAGIGPEIVLKALRDPAVHEICTPVLIGSPGVFLTHAAVLKMRTRLTPIEEAGGWEAPQTDKGYLIAPTGAPDETDRTRIGVADASSGRAAYDAIRKAVELALQGRIQAMVTAPISKEGLAMAGINYPGHTEMIADMCGEDEAVMMLIGGGIKVALVTIHCALRDVFALLTPERLMRVIRVTHGAFTHMNQSDVRIAVCGLNPHAGENCLFGTEERDIIAPVIAQAKKQGIDARGPFPADTVFMRALRGEFDVIIAMYHDQGLIPVKTLDFHNGVNITLGLPVVRTSVDHGTAYDIAGQNKASGQSMIAAITAAVELACGRLP
jgi:4-phospho-D-threonate 3-dehydrogenase / 4-phospho-D-erythronate 3-dehydrogenase